jgi:hypothetical protein
LGDRGFTKLQRYHLVWNCYLDIEDMAGKWQLMPPRLKKAANMKWKSHICYNLSHLLQSFPYFIKGTGETKQRLASNL